MYQLLILSVRLIELSEFKAFKYLNNIKVIAPQMFAIEPVIKP